MTRARLIKPGFFLNEELAELPYPARILFAGLWCIADREGRLEDRPKRIKHETLPYDDEDVDALLTQLHEAGVITRYEVDGSRYIHVVNFRKHQSPHIHEAASAIPAPRGESGEHGTSMVQAPYKHDSRPSVPIVNSNPIAIPIEVPGEGDTLASPTTDTPTTDAADAAGGALAPADNPSLKPPLKTFSPEDAPYQLAAQLRDAVLAHNPKATDAVKAKQPNGIQAWARQMETLLREKRRAPPEVRAIIAYAFAGSDGFWRPHLLNPAKLKQKLDTIDGQRRESANGANHGHGGNGGNGGNKGHEKAHQQRGYAADAGRGHAADVASGGGASAGANGASGASGASSDGLNKWERWARDHNY